MRKAVLRKLYLEKRKNLSLQDYQEKNRQLLQYFLDFFSSQPFQAVHCFLPILHQKEPDTWPIIRALQARGVTVVVSRSDLESNTLSHYPLTEDIILQNNRWGIPEPVATGDCFPVQNIDAVIVPLLAFDQKGHRAGYGKGYYDRFLAECRSDTIKIGLSIEPPVAEIEDIDGKFDVKLHYCVTPEKVWVF